ncbi:Ub6p like ubiquitin at N-terminus and ubiquitin C terminal hydrolase at the C-terminus [Cryptosporidium ryanae]|uniref:Ub6p like ubiquitin at N-terminus and ubiquitin C terminal hydrolase at the C-terminus n=1 Tax=Cryptosporidium ryanae TaxID=515981 RepID=UPI00351A9FA4|nr:Ub6p like ubiquitin at N-terminus and ubiquitin C terminal hydrolase at the C-terminus [Cryptosporidium ryanae]
MDKIKVTVKWNNSVYDDIDIDLSAPIYEFREKLTELTGVLPGKQKLMSQRGVLRDGIDLRKLGLKPGSKIVLVGTAESGHLKNPAEKTVFIEDLTSAERAKILNEKKIDPLPVGLENLGNTCYLNSIIHFLRSIPSFSQILKRSEIGATSSSDGRTDVRFLNSFRQLMNKMDGSIEAVTPGECVDLFRHQFPQYSVISGGQLGTYQQQDAEEVLGSLITLFKNGLDGKDDEKNSFGDIFRFRMRTKFTNIETEKEEEVKNEENFKLMCHMGTQLSPVDYLTQGIKLSLDEVVEKKSSETGLDSKYRKVSEIDSLPPFLLVHLVRFEWKKSSEIARTEATRAKVCRKIEFSQNLDLYEFCSDDLKKILNIGRDIIELKRKCELNEIESNNQSETKNDESLTYTDCPTGVYELECIITHQGRTADSGHYVAWRYCPDNREYIFKFDDEKVSKLKVKDVDLSGGRSDYHIAVMLLYRGKVVKASDEEMASLVGA